MPLFSIITVTLNPPAEDFQKTLESILDQGFEDWELIVKDGGSDAGVLSNVPDDPRIRVVVQEDTGIFDAMNQSLGYADGGFICFLNAGDFFYDKKVLEAVAKVVLSSPEVEFCYGDVAKPYSRSGFEIYPSKLTRRYVFSHAICHQAWFVSSSYYNRPERYDAKHVVGGDPVFLLKMILCNQVSYKKVNRVLVSYAGGGVSQDPKHVASKQRRMRILKRRLYGKIEYRWFRMIELIKKLLKVVFYDTGAWRFLRRYRGSSDQFKK